MPRVERLASHVALIDEGKVSVAVTTDLVLSVRDKIDEIARLFDGGVSRSVASLNAGYAIERSHDHLRERPNLSIGGLIDAMLQFGFLVDCSTPDVGPIIRAEYAEEDSLATAAAIVLFLDEALGG